MDKEITKRLTIKIARILDNKKADDVKIYDLLGLSSLCDYVIIATAASAPHLDALEREASVELKKENIYKTNRDGGNGGVWRVSDYGGFMLHIMTASAREFYALDKVFSFGKETIWKEIQIKVRKPRVKTASYSISAALKNKSPQNAKNKTKKSLIKKSDVAKKTSLQLKINKPKTSANKRASRPITKKSNGKTAKKVKK